MRCAVRCDAAGDGAVACVTGRLAAVTVAGWYPQSCSASLRFAEAHVDVRSPLLSAVCCVLCAVCWLAVRLLSARLHMSVGDCAYHSLRNGACAAATFSDVLCCRCADRDAMLAGAAAASGS